MPLTCRKKITPPSVPAGAPHNAVQNTMTTTTGSQGGYVVPIGFSNMIEEALKWFGGMDVCGKFTTGTGNPLNYPTVNDASLTPGALSGKTSRLPIPMSPSVNRISALIYFLPTFALFRKRS